MFDEEDELSDALFKSELERYEEMIRQNDVYYFDSEMLERIIDHFIIKNQIKSALEAIEYAKNQHPSKTCFELKEAQILSTTGKLKESLLILQRLEKIEPANTELYVTKASVFSQLRDHVKAIKYFEKAIEIASEYEDPGIVEEIRFDLALEYENIMDFMTAIRVLNEILALTPNNEAAIYEIAYCYERIGEFDKCIRYYNMYIDNNPYSFTAWYNLGNIYFLKNNIEKAIWAYDYAIVINDEFSSAHFNMGNTYMQNGEFEKARRCYLKCIDIDGEEALTLSYLGETYERMEQYDEAIIYYNKSKELSPDLAEPWLGIGIILEMRGEVSQALNYLKHAVSLQPENAHFRHVLGEALFNAGHLVEAETELERALQIDPLYSEVIVVLAKLKEAFNIHEALEFLRSLGNIETYDKEVRIMFVTILWKAGKKTDSLTLFQKEYRADKTVSAILLQLFPESEFIPEFNQITNNDQKL